MASPKTIGRLQAQIQRRVAYCLQFEIADPRASFVTVTKVELSNDLARAKVSYSVLGSEGDRSKVQHMLTGASGFIRRQLGRVLETRNIPALTWEYDPSAEDAANLSRIIQEARKRDEEIRGVNPTSGSEGALDPDADPEGDQGPAGDPGLDASDAAEDAPGSV
ncbi:MAG: 30S ribosome-binding factor RbfA [Planctomycetota bacterium]